jgi:hypothetical protein
VWYASGRISRGIHAANPPNHKPCPPDTTKYFVL